jgi:hypothetical protein
MRPLARANQEFTTVLLAIFASIEKLRSEADHLRIPAFLQQWLSVLYSAVIDGCRDRYRPVGSAVHLPMGMKPAQ